jgi:hypothetical protein
MLELIAEARAAGTMPTKEEALDLSDAVRKRFGETTELVAQQQDRSARQRRRSGCATC